MNGDLTLYDGETRGQIHATICAEHGLHPSQLDLIDMDEEDEHSVDQKDEDVVCAFISPKRRVFLSHFPRSFLINDVQINEEYDPWTKPFSKVYRGCQNESILRHLFQTCTTDELPPEVFANPHPFVVEETLRMHIGTHITHDRYLAMCRNPNDKVIDWLIERYGSPDFSYNPNPRVIEYLFDQVRAKEIDDPGVKYSTRYWSELLCLPYASRELVDYALTKLRAIEVSDEDVMHTVFESKSENKNVWTALAPFVKDKYRENRENREDILDIFLAQSLACGEYTAVAEWMYTEKSRLLESRGKLSRLAKVSDSDEIVGWFLAAPNDWAREKYRHLLLANPNEMLVQYYLDHPDEVGDVLSFLANPNPRSRGLGLGRKAHQFFYTPAPHHLFQILDSPSPPQKIRMSTLLESLSQTDDVEVVFDNDVRVNFLSGEKMTFLVGSDEKEIVETIARRHKVTGDCVELVGIVEDDEDNVDREKYNKKYCEYFALIKTREKL